jgi:hypothetical protein
MIEAFERSMIKSIWKHSICQWDFRNDESRKDKTRYVAGYKQHTLDGKIKATYQDKDNLMHPLNPLQEQQFNIPIEELLLMSCNTIKAWLRSSELYIRQAEAHTTLS